jgi:hypothetical protein
MGQVKTKQLGLAAFIRMSGAPLVEVKDKAFVFQSDKTEAEWRVEYSNSCCMRHDTLVCELRKHLKQ